jgi:biotin synthase
MKELIDKLHTDMTLSREDFVRLLKGISEEEVRYLLSKSRATADGLFGKRIFMRGLIEFSNYCKNDCYYCGIRHGNKKVERYRLGKDEILSCCRKGYALGFRTFVLQSGEDPYFTVERMADIVSLIRKAYPDCAITLSIGEKTYEEYQKLRQAGADRFLLRHETADEEHYRKLHPGSLSPANRKRCLFDLKKLGYQVGTGFMVGSPWQTVENLADDLLFIKELRPHMVGIGPYISHKDTPFAGFQSGPLNTTLILIGILRLMLPDALIPATTSLGTIHPEGRELGILAGANVLMPNLTPVEAKKKYMLYDKKICIGEEVAECLECLKHRLAKIGYELVTDRGDYVNMVDYDLKEAKYELERYAKV